MSILLLRTRRLKKKGGYEDLIGQRTRVVKVESGPPYYGWIDLRGETWKFEASTPVHSGDFVKVISHHGLLLKVHKESDSRVSEK